MAVNTSDPVAAAGVSCIGVYSTMKVKYCFRMTGQRRVTVYVLLSLLPIVVVGVVCLKFRGQYAVVCLTNRSGQNISEVSIDLFGTSPSRIHGQ
jgi:hypothetical protein